MKRYEGSTFTLKGHAKAAHPRWHSTQISGAFWNGDAEAVRWYRLTADQGLDLRIPYLLGHVRQAPRSSQHDAEPFADIGSLRIGLAGRRTASAALPTAMAFSGRCSKPCAGARKPIQGLAVSSSTSGSSADGEGVCSTNATRMRRCSCSRVLSVRCGSGGIYASCKVSV